MAEFLISTGLDKTGTDGSDFTAYELVADDPIFDPLREVLK